jgi:hypothetical protein
MKNTTASPVYDSNAMKDSTRWFGWIVVINALHMLEQLAFGIGELATLKRILAVYYGWFRQPDYGTVVLVLTVSTIVFSMIFAILTGGLWRDLSAGALSIVAIGEVHHVIETTYAGHYTPGTATAVPYVAAGVLLLRALLRERRGATIATQREKKVAVAAQS